MTLYMLTWENDLTFDDGDDTLLGIYASREERQMAIERYDTMGNHSWPFNEEGRYRLWELKLGRDIYLDPPESPGNRL